MLLIIFMVISPSISNGLDTRVPQPSDQKPSPPSDDIVISVLADGTVRLNQEPVAIAELEGRLKAIFRRDPNHPVFVRGDRKLDFEQVAQVIDIAKGAGLQQVALMTQR